MPEESTSARFRRRRRPTAARSEKLFGRYDDLVRLVIGFVLTGVVGTYLAQMYTTRQANLQAANKLFSDYSKSLGDRYFAQGQADLSLKERQSDSPGNDSAVLQRRWETYRTEIQEWNSARGYNREMIGMYFGDDVWNAERDIHYGLRAWGMALEREYKAPGTVDFSCTKKLADEMLVLMHDIRFQMSHALKAGTLSPREEVLSRRERSGEDPVPCMKTPS